ncbi:HpcH/HpaI aldolase/citrate lyase family protein [Methylophaga thalassica]|uniref:HpcH/HpaI aldolase/citrate lyase family protein n=1 Tax=Methylophaga aminisulfidivorans TaxID=230105 RepID=UPI003A8F9609
MTILIHPNDALVDDISPLPLIPACEHFAGSRHTLLKAFSIQSEYGPVFDITCDCEDGAASGGEIQHANMIVELLNSEHNIHHMSGIRIHGYDHSVWRQEIDILLSGARDNIRYITLPKAKNADQVEVMLEYIQQASQRYNITHPIPIHVLIETHGALNDVYKIAAMKPVQVLDFGIMDYISAYQGAITDNAMHSPTQFEHALIVRAKTEIACAAISSGCIPSHNVTLAIKDYQQTFEDAYRARNQFGFLRMWSVHPQQIKAIIKAMTPESEKIQLASEILLTAQQRSWAPISLNDKLYDKASYRYYWQLLQRAHLSGEKLSTDVQEQFF